MRILSAKKLRLNRFAQASIEFAFAFIVLILIFYGAIKAMQWLGLSLGSPAERHYHGLYTWSGASSGSPTIDPCEQLEAADIAASQGTPTLRMIFNGQLVNP